MSGLNARIDSLRRSFWAPAAAALAAGLVLGLLMPSVDGWLDLDLPLVEIERDSGSSLLQTIGTVVMSIIGISFSVIVVALQLASQQLSPRVLRTFQTDRLSKVVLSLLVATFMYCLAVLARLGSVPSQVAELSVAVAIGLAIFSVILFVAFIHRMVDLLQASTVIRRIGEDARATLEQRFPDGIGHTPDDAEAARASARRRMDATRGHEVRARHGGYLTSIAAEDLFEAAERRDGLVCQRMMVGDFVVPGMVLAEIWSSEPDELEERVADAFQLSEERTLVHDPAFPIRQLADVALRGLSPGLNDPTTAENAMGTLAETLVGFAERDQPVETRVDRDGRPRFMARVPTLDELVRLGFEQVRISAESYPVFRARLAVLLEAIQGASRRAGRESDELDRQLRLLAES